MRKTILAIFISLGLHFWLMAQEGVQILKKHFDAVGQELWLQVTDVTIDGRWVDEEYRGYAIKLYYKPEGKIRIEGTFGNRDFVEATNGLVPWILAPWKETYEPQLMEAQERVILNNSFSLGSPVYAIKDQLRFNGLVDFEGEVYLTYVYEDEKVKRTVYLGRTDYKIYYERFESKEKAFDPILKVYEKYQTYSGLVVPTAVRFEGEDLEKELVYDEVFIGLGVKNSLFELPKGQ